MRSLKLAWFAVAALAAGCNPNPFCLNCQPGAGDGGSDAIVEMADMVAVDMTPMVDLQPDVATGCIPTNNGVEICDHIDNDCNDPMGKGVDDVDPMKLQQDPKNCGACFNECSYVNAFGLCVNGQCQMGQCQPGYFDLDGDPNNGCEYQCIVNPIPKQCMGNNDCPQGIPCTGGICGQACGDASGAGDKGGCPVGTACRDLGTKVCVGELCDAKDNNCNGKTDEGFDLANDPQNCGGCGIICNLPNSSVTCVNAKCGLGMCNVGFKDLDGNPANGCEYQCPVFPTKAETCNGTDDDCDGQIDNNPNDVGTACDDFCPPLAPCVGNNSCTFKLSACMGKCCGICTQGKTICAGGMPVCQMGKGPALEVCNNLDDNCDGQVDEGFNLQTDPLNCGACGNACTLPNAVAGCAAGKCTVATCKPGFADLDKNPNNGCEYTCPVNPPTNETCNGKDDDCNGVVDDALKVPPNFCNQNSICVGAAPVCCGMSGWLCNYPTVNNHIEVTNVVACQNNVMGGNLAIAEMLCDGFDGNCNTQIDESFPNKGKPCSAGNGRCAGNGVFVCTMDFKSTTCPAVANPNMAIDELCNGLDDDCDGQIDERTPQNGATCFNGNQHACIGWVDPMAHVTGGNGNYYIYRYEATHPDATGVLVGADTSRACANANVLPWAPVTQTAAAAACAAVKDSMGQAMRLCTAAEWQQACNLGIAANPVWSYQTNPAVYAGATCNGFDRGLGKPWATGSGASCIANPANQTNGVVSTASIFDMSGNVAEWTSTQVMANMKTYYQVKGGAYNNFATGINCDFNFTIELPTYQFNDLGFRCCSNNAP